MSAPPPDVASAARVVQSWLDQQNGTPQPPARRLSDAEKLERCRQFDQSKMPPNKYDVERAGRS
jgi:hypothetical protein